LIRVGLGGAIVYVAAHAIAVDVVVDVVWAGVGVIGQTVPIEVSEVDVAQVDAAVSVGL